MSADFLRLLADGADRAALDAALGDAPDPEAREQHQLALRVHEELSRQRSREAELSALNQTASDLIVIRDLDTILAAIVRRARQLLRADMTYLSLNDDEASYMKVTDGALTREFGELRLPLGTGLLGLVAQIGAPYFTADYQADARFLHRGYIDDAVAAEQIRAILGVPLVVDGQVIGALLAVHRTVRQFPASEVALLTAFAAHAAVALENARLFDRVRSAVAAADEANEQLRRRSEATEQSGQTHDQMTDALLNGGGVEEVAAVVAASLGGPLAVYDEDGRRLVGGPDAPDPDLLTDDVATARASGHAVRRADGTWLAVAAAGEQHLGTLVARPTTELDEVRRRTLERAALVIALVLLFRRTEAEADERVRGELLGDLLEAPPRTWGGSPSGCGCTGPT
ncbi:GAF domain-containing protein [Nocardioides sambongensis]|uniref:GAF domain-containing protein n=1 Tax=Nocardioides sambongensis TaxID=2589074 RepID=UPI001127A5B9|nr:GAF domain-containing protein [Nocardioides sambongensis]